MTIEHCLYGLHSKILDERDESRLVAYLHKVNGAASSFLFRAEFKPLEDAWNDLQEDCKKVLERYSTNSLEDKAAFCRRFLEEFEDGLEYAPRLVRYFFESPQVDSDMAYWFLKEAGIFVVAGLGEGEEGDGFRVCYWAEVSGALDFLEIDY